MPEVMVVNTGTCNLDSIKRALEECGANVVVATKPQEIGRASRLVLPGVGAFDVAMSHLSTSDMLEPLRERALGARIPFLGICLGMQLLASRGEENGFNEGLNLIEGEVVRLIPENSERVPHMGWNQVNFSTDCPLGRGLNMGRDFYFVHSFHFKTSNPRDVAAQTPYCGLFSSVVGHENIWGTQFHPEKSQKSGFTLLRNFLAL